MRVHVPFTPYVWVRGIRPDKGTPEVVGPFETSHEALEGAGDLEHVREFRLKTRDRSAATAMIKAQLLKEQKNSSTALQRVLHRDAPAGAESEDGGPEATPGTPAVAAPTEAPKKGSIWDGDF